MKKVLVIALSFACLATVGQAEWLGEGQQSVRLDYVFADDVGSADAHGVEIAFGTAVYELDDAAMYFLHQENSDMDSQQLGLSVQQHFPISSWSIGLVPYAGAGAGYAWVNADDDIADVENGGWVGRIELGAILHVCDYFAFNAGTRYNLSTDDIFLSEGSGADNDQWSFVIGGRFYY